MNVQEYNSKAWDRLVTKDDQWTVPVSTEVIENARKGEFSIVLTPNIPVPRDWFPDDFKGIDILGLASGGGQQMPILAALGANVTSFDNSRKQLEQDTFVAERDGLDIRVEQGDAADLSRFDDESFDLIWHPCSNCFMPKLQPVWDEAFRVLRKGGAMLSGFHNSFLFIFDRLKDEEDDILEVKHSLPYSDLKDLTDEERARFIPNDEPLEFGHTLDQQIGGQIEAGFIISGFFEDYWSDEATALNKYCPTFIATKAIKM
ncbi:MAG: class I SAM-dependent methyltransferase [Pyrinomonadaceae bacterium]|nr:class I SAM-dependent methyltransferase [Pyrinomonadaceae bacterium]